MEKVIITSLIAQKNLWNLDSWSFRCGSMPIRLVVRISLNFIFVLPATCLFCLFCPWNEKREKSVFCIYLLSSTQLHILAIDSYSCVFLLLFCAYCSRFRGLKRPQAHHNQARAWYSRFPLERCPFLLLSTPRKGFLSFESTLIA